MEFNSLLQALAPLAVALLTVPLMEALQKAVVWLDGQMAFVKQIVVVLIAWVLTQLGGLLDLALPTDLALFTGNDMEAVIAAAVAFAIHAGRKAKGDT